MSLNKTALPASRILLRPEEPKDYREVEAVTREAFWNHYVPGCSEHFIAHVMRKSPDFIKELSLVALVDDKIIGNIMYTKSKIACDNGKEVTTITFGPISVLPEYQNEGIGTMLITHTLKKAAMLGCKAVIIMGDPLYYARFGFVPAEKFGIGTSDNMYADALLAVELVPGGLKGCSGCFFDAPCFNIDESLLELFEMEFPPKEKVGDLPSQKRFELLASMAKPRE